MKILSWFFSFYDKYYEQQERYEISRYPFFKFLLFIITAALPTLMFRAAFKIGFGEAWFGALFVLIMAFMLLVKTPKDLFLLSLVAINHGIWVLATRKKVQAPTEQEPTEEVYEPETKKKKRGAKWEKTESNPLWDFLLGILGMVLSVASIILPFVVFFYSFR